MSKIIHKELSFKTVGAAMQVHRIPGPGFLEAVYHAALAHELTLRQIPFEQYKRLKVVYKGQEVGDYEADFVVDGKIILELKAISTFHPKHEAQALTATGFKLGRRKSSRGTDIFREIRLSDSNQTFEITYWDLWFI